MRSENKFICEVVVRLKMIQLNNGLYDPFETMKNNVE